MNWACVTSLDQLWRSPTFPMWLTLPASAFRRLWSWGERDWDGGLTDVLAARVDGRPSACAAFWSVTVSNVTGSYMHWRSSEGLIVRCSPSWTWPAAAPALVPALPPLI